MNGKATDTTRTEGVVCWKVRLRYTSKTEKNQKTSMQATTTTNNKNQKTNHSEFTLI